MAPIIGLQILDLIRREGVNLELTDEFSYDPAETQPPPQVAVQFKSQEAARAFRDLLEQALPQVA